MHLSLDQLQSCKLLYLTEDNNPGGTFKNNLFLKKIQNANVSTVHKILIIDSDLESLVSDLQ